MSLFYFRDFQKPKPPANARNRERSLMLHIPNMFTVKAHNQAGILDGNPLEWKAEGNIEVFPFLPARDRESGSTATAPGREVYERFKNSQPLNAAVQEYLLDYPDLIPPSWQGKKVLFLGTVLGNRVDKPVVPSLWCQDGVWKSEYEELDKAWGPNYVIAMKKGSFKGDPFILPAKKAA